MSLDSPDADGTITMTLEAFADTVIPGEKRSAKDWAIAGVSDGGGAVAAGAIALIREPAGGLADIVDHLAVALNAHAETYASNHGVTLDGTLPAFVALPFADRTALVQALVAPGHPERELWIPLLMFSNMAFDTGAHMHTTEAIAAGHPGLTSMRFELPEPDGLWRFPAFSYRRELATRHPQTTATGSPA
ncbi:DUF5987 family protein [Micromonospora sp. NPDC051543]|uniref:DUF5987 family protein n=1 Tax=Micromonospora sp. NPDC051543 TaxID=3364287 RepID=UPI0037AEDC1E